MRDSPRADGYADPEENAALLRVFRAGAHHVGKTWHPSGPRHLRNLQRATVVFWAFIAVIALSLLAITLSSRGVVRAVGGVLLAGLLVFGLVLRLANEPGPDPDQRGKPTSPAAAVTSIPLDAIKVADLKLTGGGAPFELRGTIQNLSGDTRVRSITLRIVRRDCFEGALDPTGCAVIWQDQHWIPVNVPPDAERKFDASFYARAPVSRLRGTMKDEFRLVAASGEPATP